MEKENQRKRPNIFIHSDLDACLSLFIARKVMKGFENANVVEKPADWRGDGIRPADKKNGFPGDLALDMDCGIKGERGADGKVHSCSKYLAENYAPENAKKILLPLVTFTDTQDAYGAGHKHLAPELADLPEAEEIFSLTGINQVLRAIQRMSNRDFNFVCDKMCEIFEGMYKNTSSLPQLRDLLAELILEFAENYNSTQDIKAMAPLLEFTRGYDVYKHHIPNVPGETREIFSKTGILGVYGGICTLCSDEKEIKEKMFLIFEGMRLNGLSIQRNKREAEKAKYFLNGQIAIADELPWGAHRPVKERKEVVFFLYKIGWTIGVNLGHRDRI